MDIRYEDYGRRRKICLAVFNYHRPDMQIIHRCDFIRSKHPEEYEHIGNWHVKYKFKAL